MATRNIAAVDLGAESGRVILARFDGQNLGLEEVYRFPNRPVTLHGHRFWNMLGLWNEILAGLRKARQTDRTLDSIGVDTPEDLDRVRTLLSRREAPEPVSARHAP